MRLSKADRDFTLDNTGVEASVCRNIDRVRRVLATSLAIFVSLSLGHAAASYGTPSAASMRIGASLQARSLDVVCVGTGEQTILVVGGIHTGPERVTTVLASEIANAASSGDLAVPAAIRLCVLPVLNPDGLALGRRTNENDVDLNRNWPAGDWRAEAVHSQDGLVEAGVQPLSEPETRALFDYVVRTRPAVVLMLHCCCGGLAEANEAPAAAGLGEIYAAAVGLDYIEEWGAHPITGQFIDAMEFQGIPAIDVELSQADDTGFAAHRSGVVALMYYLATHPPVGLAAGNELLP